MSEPDASTADATNDAASAGDGVTPACTEPGSSPADPSTDGPQTSGDASSDMCGDQVGSCPARSFAKWTVLLDARDFGPDARLVATDGSAVIVALGDGGFEVAQLSSPLDLWDSEFSWPSTSVPVPGHTSWALPVDGLTPIAIAQGNVPSASDVPPVHELFVLACGNAGAQCQMLRSELDQEELGPWREEALPAEFRGRGIVFDAAAERRTPCVYGSGLLCFQGGWQAEIAAESDLDLRDVAIMGSWSLAVGDHGRWFKRERDFCSGDLGPWEEQAALGDPTLSQASTFGRGGVIVGEGRVVAALGTQRAVHSCGVPRQVVALWLDHAGLGLDYAVTDGGEVLRHARDPSGPEPYCSYDVVDMEGFLDSAVWPCMNSTNPRVLTEQTLQGEHSCVLID